MAPDRIVWALGGTSVAALLGREGRGAADERLIRHCQTAGCVMTPGSKTAGDVLREWRITPSSDAPGRYYTTCPQCSRSRQKRHQPLPCLGVTIDSNGVGWKCFHCGWRGGAFYDGRRTRCRASGRGVAPAVPRTALKKTASQDEAQRTSHALRMFADACGLRDTPGWQYLRSRGINLGALPEGIDEVVRWHPNCPWGQGGMRHACLVALWTDAITGEPRAVHRRPITAAGEKVDGWKALGPTTGCVIRLWSDDIVTNGVVIGEGVETTLAAATRIQHRGTLLTPAWATGDAGHIEKFPVLPGIDALTVLVDHDENGRGQRAAAECARRWRAAGREVTQLIPRITGEDFADLVGEPS